MEKFKPGQVSLQIRHFYAPDTLAGKLEQHLFAQGKTAGFGTAPLMTEEIVKDMREMQPNMRAYRTWCIRQLSPDGLLKVQAFERSKMDRGLERTEMERIAKEKIEPREFTPAEREYIVQWNQDHKPAMKKYDGYLVPPYFIYDLEFNGTQYHHEWDHLVRTGEWDLPQAKGKKSDEFI